MANHDETKPGSWIVALAAALAVAGLSTLGPVGCNTTEGFGEDLEAAGEGLQDEAREEKYDDEFEDD